MIALQKRCHNEHRKVETMELEANSPAALLSQLRDLKTTDVLFLGVPRTYLAKAINKGVFKKYLNRMTNRCAIIITTAKHKKIDDV